MLPHVSCLPDLSSFTCELIAQGPVNLYLSSRSKGMCSHPKQAVSRGLGVDAPDFLFWSANFLIADRGQVILPPLSLSLFTYKMRKMPFIVQDSCEVMYVKRSWNILSA